MEAVFFAKTLELWARALEGIAHDLDESCSGQRQELDIYTGNIWVRPVVDVLYDTFGLFPQFYEKRKGVLEPTEELWVTAIELKSLAQELLRMRKQPMEKNVGYLMMYMSNLVFLLEKILLRIDQACDGPRVTWTRYKPKGVFDMSVVIEKKSPTTHPDEFEHMVGLLLPLTDLQTLIEKIGSSQDTFSFFIQPQNPGASYTVEEGVNDDSY